MSRTRKLLPLLAQMTDTGPPLSLADIADTTALSRTYAQRVFAAQTGESPAKYQQRLRLERGAFELRSSDIRIIDIAIMVGFQSHEAFTRAFSAHFGISPSAYRERSEPLTEESRQWFASASPCVGLYRLPLEPTTSPATKELSMPSSPVTRESVDETPTVAARRRVKREALHEAIGECLPMAYAYAIEKGLVMAGPPFVRYLSQSPAFVEIEAGVPLIAPAGAVDTPELFAGTLPGGDAAISIHMGSYDSLGDTHIVLDRWIDENDATSAGGPWEIYLTDPGEVPDPNDWQTKVIWPLS